MRQSGSAESWDPVAHKQRAAAVGELGVSGRKDRPWMSVYGSKMYLQGKAGLLCKVSVLVWVSWKVLMAFQLEMKDKPGPITLSSKNTQCTY